jgi:hypothetical protein
VLFLSGIVVVNHGMVIMKSELPSTEQLLTDLGLAIDEAKLVRSLIKSQDLARKLKEENPFSERLIYMNKEVRYMEDKLIKLRKVRGDNLRPVYSQNP